MARRTIRGCPIVETFFQHQTKRPTAMTLQSLINASQMNCHTINEEQSAAFTYESTSKEAKIKESDQHRTTLNDTQNLTQLDNLKGRILNETKNVSSFVVIGETLYKLYYEDKLVKNQKEFLDWTKVNLGFR